MAWQSANSVSHRPRVSRPVDNSAKLGSPAPSCRKDNVLTTRFAFPNRDLDWISCDVSRSHWVLLVNNVDFQGDDREFDRIEMISSHDRVSDDTPMEGRQQ